jgi:hypothetical protein
VHRVAGIGAFKELDDGYQWLGWGVDITQVEARNSRLPEDGDIASHGFMIRRFGQGSTFAFPIG